MQLSSIFLYDNEEYCDSCLLECEQYITQWRIKYGAVKMPVASVVRGYLGLRNSTELS